MSSRGARILWGALIAAVGVALFVVYRHYFFGAAGALRWVKDGIHYELLDPRALGVVLITPLLLFVLGRSLADLPWPQRVLSVLLRVAFLALLGLGLSRLVRSEETHKVCTVLLVDVSDSVPDEAVADARHSVEQYAQAKTPDD
ncbi:MAG TPA: hypothetical protein VGM44_12580, partial [Polyangiaceae bacterium]